MRYYMPIVGFLGLNSAAYAQECAGGETVFVEVHPVEIICSGSTSSTSSVVTRAVCTDGPPTVFTITETSTGDVPGTTTLPPPADCGPYCTQTVVVTRTIPPPPDYPTGITTISTTGSVPGTETIPPASDCITDCTSTIRITNTPPPVGITTQTTTGSVPGTETIPPASDCITDCSSTIRITRTPPPGGITTQTTTGSVPGTETIPPPSGCTTDCTSTIRITRTPPPVGITTQTTTGSVPGTTTIPPASDCTTDCTSTIRITRTPPPVGITTQTTTGSVPGTTTIPPASDCTTECTSTIRITRTPPGEITTQTTTGSVPGTTTIPPASDCVTSCTSTVRITETPTCTPGLEWAAYGLSEGTGVGQFPDNPDEPGEEQDAWPYTGFVIDRALEGQTPANIGNTTTFGFFYNNSTQQCTGNLDIYGTQTDISPQFSVVQHIGYFHPSETGTYTFTAGKLDDGIYLWFGDDAKSGFNNDNADLVTNYNNDIRVYTIDATAGEYIPFRLLQVNAQVCSQFELTVTDPDGNVVVSGTQPTDDQFVHGCPEAPEFDF